MEILKPYLDNIKEWSALEKENQVVEFELLNEDDYNTKSYIVGTYDDGLNMILIRVLRMFTSKLEVETKEDLMVSCDLDISHCLRCSTLRNNEIIRIEVKQFIDIVKKSYETGARIGMD